MSYRVTGHEIADPEWPQHGLAREAHFVEAGESGPEGQVMWTWAGGGNQFWASSATKFRDIGPRAERLRKARS